MNQQATIPAITDVGGTFTDRQEIITAKADTTPPNFKVIKKLEYHVDPQGKTLRPQALTSRCD